MSRYTAGFSKDMIDAYNASKSTISNFNLWCENNPGRLTTDETFLVLHAIRRTRCANNAFKLRLRRKELAEKTAMDTIWLEKENKRLRTDLAKLQRKYNVLLEKIKSKYKSNDQFNKDVACPALLTTPFPEPEDMQNAAPVIEEIHNISVAAEPTTIIDLLDGDDIFSNCTWLDNFDFDF